MSEHNHSARSAAVDRRPKPCLHKQANHVHGTRACYVLDRCRCRPCARAASAYENNRTRQQAYGRWNGLVDAEPARAHVRHLMAQGMGLKRIVEVSGVTHSVLWKLIYGKVRADGTRIPSKRIRPATHAALLATRVDLAPGAKVDATGTRRRLQALACLGWSLPAIAEQIGLERQALDRILKGGLATTRKTADAVAAVYDQLWDTPPTPRNRGHRAAISRTRRTARRNGWLPPLAWDDSHIDDPAAIPDLGNVERHANGRTNRIGALVEDVEYLLGAGVAPAEIPGRVGYRNAQGVERALARAGRHDLARRIHLRKGTAA